MKKLTILLLLATFFASCAHQHKCACGSMAKTECAGCKHSDDSKEETCNCKK